MTPVEPAASSINAARELVAQELESEPSPIPVPIQVEPQLEFS